MLVETKQIIPSAEFQKALTRPARELSETKEPVYILKNNHKQALMQPFAESECLIKPEEPFKCYEIADMRSARIKSHDVKKSVAWEKIKE